MQERRRSAEDKARYPEPLAGPRSYSRCLAYRFPLKFLNSFLLLMIRIFVLDALTEEIVRNELELTVFLLDIMGFLVQMYLISHNLHESEIF